MSAPLADPAWRLRNYQPGDDEAVADLLAQGFGRALEAATWRWKLLGRPSPVANVWLVADAENRPIFHYGGIARRWQIDGEERDLMVAVDSVTDPAHRRKGLLAVGGGAAHQAWGEAGFAGIFGLPNEQWRTRYDTFGWQELFPLRWCIYPLRPERLLAKRLGLPVLGRLHLLGHLWSTLWQKRRDRHVSVRPIDTAGQLDAFWQLYQPAETYALKRDHQWLSWRYFACPTYRYRVFLAERDGDPVGYLVYRFDPASRYGFVAEFVTLPGEPKAARALLTAALLALQERQASAVATLAVPGSTLHRTYQRHGFLFSWGAFRLCFIPLASEPAVEALRDPRRWQIHGGDFDVI